MGEPPVMKEKPGWGPYCDIYVNRILSGMKGDLEWGTKLLFTVQYYSHLKKSVATDFNNNFARGTALFDVVTTYYTLLLRSTFLQIHM